MRGRAIRPEGPPSVKTILRRTRIRLKSAWRLRASVVGFIKEAWLILFDPDEYDRRYQERLGRWAQHVVDPRSDVRRSLEGFYWPIKGTRRNKR